MNYLMFIWAEGRPAPEDLAVMQREIPGWVEEMNGRGVRLLGRELRLPETAATVRVRDGETLVTDGPFMETKEFMAGFDLLECADLDEAIEVAAKAPVSWFQTVELRPLVNRVRLSEELSAFGQGDDSAGTPYLLASWRRGEAAVRSEAEDWRRYLDTQGLLVLRAALQGAETATTVRVRDAQTLLGDGPYTGTDLFVAAVDVVRCADRRRAIDLAAAHPMAREHAVEVRPFYCQ
jgi:hypothetical protein